MIWESIFPYHSIFSHIDDYMIIQPRFAKLYQSLTWLFFIITYYRKHGTSLHGRKLTITDNGDYSDGGGSDGGRSFDWRIHRHRTYSDSLKSSVPARWSEKGTYARPKIRAENNAHGVILKSRSSRVAVHSSTILFCPVQARWSRTGIFSRCVCVCLSRLLFLFLRCLAVSIFLCLGIHKKERSCRTTVVNHVL